MFAMPGSVFAPSRTIASSRTGTTGSGSPAASRSVRATCWNVSGSPTEARNRCPAASGIVTARMCRSATSRTSTTVVARRGTAGAFISARASPTDAGKSVASGGPKMPTGFTTANSTEPPSVAMKSQAARSATALERMYAPSGASVLVQSSSVNSRSLGACP